MWWFPRRLPQDDQVVDPVDFAEGYLPAAEEFGRLDETNFNDSIQTELDPDADLAGDISERWVVKQVAYEWDDIRTVAAAGRGSIAAVGTWEGVDELDHSFAGRGGYLDVHATLQCWRFPENVEVLRSVAYLQMGIEIDGTVVMEGAIGDFDDADEGQAMETGRTGLVWRDALSVLYPVGVGYHRVRVVARLLPRVATYFNDSDPFNLNDLTGGSPPTADPYGKVYFGSREMLIVERT